MFRRVSTSGTEGACNRRRVPRRGVVLFGRAVPGAGGVVSPEGFQSEGPLTMAAYQSLTGIDTFYWFAAGGEPEYESNPYFTFLNLNGQHPLHKWTCATPGVIMIRPPRPLRRSWSLSARMRCARSDLSIIVALLLRPPRRQSRSRW